MNRFHKGGERGWWFQETIRTQKMMLETNRVKGGWYPLQIQLKMATTNPSNPLVNSVKNYCWTEDTYTHTQSLHRLKENCTWSGAVNLGKDVERTTGELQWKKKNTEKKFQEPKVFSSAMIWTKSRSRWFRRERKGGKKNRVEPHCRILIDGHHFLV
jgi:hypothetical protein